MKTYSLDKQFIELEMLHLDCQHAQGVTAPKEKELIQLVILLLVVKKQNTLLPV